MSFIKSIRPKPRISTTSLPDIVFMLLFFFMVTTVMRKSPELLEVHEPSANAVIVLKKRSLVDHLRLGYLIGSTAEDTPRLQLDDALADMNQISAWKESCMQLRPDGQHPFVVSALHIDKGVKMKDVTHLKRELRKSGSFKISYMTTTKGARDEVGY